MRNKIHSHPKLEEKLGLGEEHVIIGRALYYELLILNYELTLARLKKQDDQIENSPLS